MTLEQFIKKHNGYFLEVAGSSNAKNQCVDLANGYIRDVLGLPIIEWTNAKDFPNHPIAKERFDFIKNTPMGVPGMGDLIIWGGKWGHIAIYLSGDVNWFTSFDQNWPIGSKCHKVDHSYSNVIGWLRPKGGSMSKTSKELTECLKIHGKLMGEIKGLKEEAEEKNKTISRQAKRLLDKEGVLKSWVNKYNTAVTEEEKAEELREKWYTLYQQVKKNNTSLKTDNTTFQTTITKMKEKSLITASRKTLLFELIKDYFGKREEVVRDEK